MCDCCSEGYCRRCGGMIWGLLGVLVLINAFVWPKWLGIDGWMAFFGILLIVAGVWKSLMPACGCDKDGSKSECCSKISNEHISIAKEPVLDLPKDIASTSKKHKKK